MSAVVEKRFVFVLGGVRSGKSGFALAFAESAAKAGKRTYIATAEARDEEMARRIEEHKRARGGGWFTVEEPLHLEKSIRENAGSGVILIDCMTLWLTNIMAVGADGAGGPGRGCEDSEVLKEVEKVSRACSECPGTVIAVSNEVGLGVVPATPLARRFRDLSGRMNQTFGAGADEVFLVSAGIPLKLK
jgi:adenosylcobinamide kinase/adenosylcobinamide-phosphate guanylyltransferase